MQIIINSSPETMVPKSCCQGRSAYGPSLIQPVSVHLAFWMRDLPLQETYLAEAVAASDKNAIRSGRHAVNRAKENLTFWQRMDAMEAQA